MTARSAPPDPMQDPKKPCSWTHAAEDREAETAEPPDEAHAGESYGRLRAVVEEYRSASIGDEGRLASLKPRIMEVLKQELSRGPSVFLETPLGRDYAITLSALRAEVRAVVDAEAGVHARRVHIIDVDVDAMTLNLRVTMTVSSRSSIPDIQHRTHPRITERLRETVGLRTGTIDLIAEDIYDD